MPAKKTAPKKKPKATVKPRQDTDSCNVFRPVAGNPNNPQYKIGFDDGLRKAHEDIIQQSPYHQLIHEKNRLTNLTEEQRHMESQLERVKKAKSLSEEKIKGLRNQVDEQLR